jgi:hypothetical protein
MLHFCNNSPAADMLVGEAACPDSEIGSVHWVHDGLTVRRPAFLQVGPLAAIVPPLTLGRASGPSFLDRAVGRHPMRPDSAIVISAGTR